MAPLEKWRGRSPRAGEARDGTSTIRYDHRWHRAKLVSRVVRSPPSGQTRFLIPIMCGICGVVRWRGAEDWSSSRTRAMRYQLEHRGPDDSGLESDERAVLGATRLVIRGSTEGHQPQRDAETGVLVVCNDEIDNHRELRRWLQDRGRNPAPESDVAVLTHLYAEKGDSFIEVLEGAFALALWDPVRDKLLLARDRTGERSLFYYQCDEEVVFATELSALALDSGAMSSLDPSGMRYYLRFGRSPRRLPLWTKFESWPPPRSFASVRTVFPSGVTGNGLWAHRFRGRLRLTPSTTSSWRRSAAKPTATWISAFS